MSSIVPTGWNKFTLPFIDREFMLKNPHNSYWQMLGYYFSPYFSFRSVSFSFIIITLVCLIFPQLFFTSTGNFQLFQYTLMPHVYLNPFQIKHVSHVYIYEVFTSLWFHTGYVHWLGNMMGVVLNVFTMEFCWLPSVFLMVLGCMVANCYAVLTTDTVMMGFSGVIACSIGLFIGMFVGNWNYIRRNHSQMMIIWMINCLFVFFLLFNFSPKSAMVHMTAFGLGIVYGVGWIPKPSPDSCESITGTVCKVLSVILTLLPVVLILIHPTATIQTKIIKTAIVGS